MAAEDRDKIFEQALAQHLRASSANSPVPSACPDAETLAAYHESSLPGDQADLATQHIHSCGRCQALLEQLKATDDLPLDISLPTAQPQTTAAPVHVMKPRRAQSWRWAAPAGAIAAAILISVIVFENPALHKPATMELAKNVASAPPVPPQLQSVPDAIAKAKSPQAAPLAAQLSPAPPRGDTRSRVSDNRNAVTYSPSPSFLPNNEPLSAPRPSGIAGARSEARGKDEVSAEEAQISRDFAAQEQKKFDSADKLEQGAAPARPSPAPSAAMSGALSSSAIAETAPATKQRLAKKPAPPSSSPVPGQQQQIEGMSRYKEVPEFIRANSTMSTTVSAPGTASSWRIGPSGFIAHSTDAGKSWTPQASVAHTDLLAGVAISDRICWIVGRAGTLLRTTDGGAHWEKLIGPTHDDLLSVSAVDARQATVTSAVGAYQTTDAGATWHKLSPQ